MSILSDIDEVVATLKQGGLVSLPTETVYGLAGDASNPLAIRQIYATKGRPAGHPVIVHMADGADLSTIAKLDDRAQALAWPAPSGLDP